MGSNATNVAKFRQIHQFYANERESGRPASLILSNLELWRNLAEFAIFATACISGHISSFGNHLEMFQKHFSLSNVLNGLILLLFDNISGQPIQHKCIQDKTDLMGYVTHR